MKIKDIQEKGLLRKGNNVLEEMEVNLSDFISDEEFNRRSLPMDKRDYREDAMNRLGMLLGTEDVSFGINCNLASNFVKRCIRIVCPRCDVDMDKEIHSSGNHNMTSHNYICPNCNAQASLSIPTQGSLTFRSGYNEEQELKIVIRTAEKLTYKELGPFIRELRKVRGVFDVRLDKASPFNIWVIINNPKPYVDSKPMLNALRLKFKDLLSQCNISGVIDYMGK